MDERDQALAEAQAQLAAVHEVLRSSGRTGFEGRFDYGAIGDVTNLAARL